MPQVHVFDQQPKLFAALATHLLEAATTALAEDGRFYLALSGGTTPAPFYRFLADYLVTNKTDLTHWYFFLVDERVVPDGHADSNFSMIKRHLFDLVALARENQFPMVLDDISPERCAENYTETLHTWLKHKNMGVPQFDYLLLGLGTDGHTASLFPNQPVLSATQSPWVISVPGKPTRISLASSVLRAARQRVFLVTGTSKANIVHKILKPARGCAEIAPGIALASASQPSSLFPALQVIHGLSSEWFLDTDAATLLSDEI